MLLTGSLLELGDRTAYVDAAAATARLASRRRNSYAQVALGWIDLSLASLRRDEAAVDRLAAELHALRPRLNPGNEALHLMGIHLISHMWDERIGELIEPIAAGHRGRRQRHGRGRPAPRDRPARATPTGCAPSCSPP